MPGGHTAVIKKYPCMPEQRANLWFDAWCSKSHAEAVQHVSVFLSLLVISSTMQWLPVILFFPLADLPAVVS